MIAGIPIARLSYSTGSTASALTASLRPVPFEKADRTESAPTGSAPLDIDRLYPNLGPASARTASNPSERVATGAQVPAGS